MITDTSEAATVDDNFSDNPRDYEVQLAKTADGQSILFKYIDNRDSLVELKKALKLVNGPTVEATLTTDIFVTYRDAADKNGWSKPTTITNDIWMNRSTWIPSIIPSLKEVPILEFINIPFTNPQNVRVMAEYPKFIQNFVIGSGIRNWILNSTFDATAGENIKNSTLQNPEGAVVSVDDLINVDINSFNIYPNPVTSTATISYEIANNAYVKIEIFNNMGELVKTVRDYSLATVGVTGFEFDASDLASGSYYISMTANGRKVTKLMNVVR